MAKKKLEIEVDIPYDIGDAVIVNIDMGCYRCGIIDSIDLSEYIDTKIIHYCILFDKRDDDSPKMDYSDGSNIVGYFDPKDLYLRSLEYDSKNTSARPDITI